MSENHELGIDELFAIGEIEKFYKATEEKCKKKIGATKFAGAEPEDVVQEALIKVHRYLPTYDASKAKLSTWIDHIISNMIKDMLAKAGTEKNLNVVNAYSIDAPANIDGGDHGGKDTFKGPSLGNTDHGFENFEVMTDLMENLGLTEREKDVFKLRIAGYTPSEIAHMYEVSTSRISQIWKDVINKYNQSDTD